MIVIDQKNEKDTHAFFCWLLSIRFDIFGHTQYVHRKNMRDLGRILQQRQVELRRLTTELHQTQTELLFTQVELDQVRRCLQRLDQRLLFAEEELDLARQGLLQASISKLVDLIHLLNSSYLSLISVEGAGWGVIFIYIHSSIFYFSYENGD